MPPIDPFLYLNMTVLADEKEKEMAGCLRVFETASKEQGEVRIKRRGLVHQSL
jgi:hypothetical protein